MSILRSRRSKPEGLRRADRESFRQYLVQLSDHFEAYHGRKENVAWTAATFYIGGIVALLSAIAANPVIRKAIGWPASAMFVIVVTLATILTGLFIKGEFASRKVAADIVGACGVLLARLANPNQEFTKEDMSSIEKRHTTNNQSYTLPSSLWAEIDIAQKNDEDGRDWLSRFVAWLDNFIGWRWLVRHHWAIWSPGCAIILFWFALIMFLPAVVPTSNQFAPTATATIATPLPSQAATVLTPAATSTPTVAVAPPSSPTITPGLSMTTAPTTDQIPSATPTNKSG